MLAHAVLILTLAAAAFAAVPVPATPCVVGDETCAVGIEMRVCVTEPCDTATVCVGFGLYCTKF